MGSPACLLPLCGGNPEFTQFLDVVPTFLDLQNLKISLNPTCSSVGKGVLLVCLVDPPLGPALDLHLF